MVNRAGRNNIENLYFNEHNGIKKMIKINKIKRLKGLLKMMAFVHKCLSLYISNTNQLRKNLDQNLLNACRDTNYFYD